MIKMPWVYLPASCSLSCVLCKSAGLAFGVVIMAHNTREAKSDDNTLKIRRLVQLY